MRVLGQLNPGDALTLVREPANEYDRYAVRVDWRGRKLGYIPRDRNRSIAVLLDTGASLPAIIVAVNRESEAWSQVEIRVEHSEAGTIPA